MFRYLHLPGLSDVTEMLWAEGPVIKLLAGGTDLLMRLDQGSEAQLLLDISRVPELRGIALMEKQTICIGACTTHQEIADHPLLQRHCHLLVQACGSVGSMQIRNRGTLGGNLGNASPAADSLPALACLDATVALASRNHSREIPIHSICSGPGKTVLGYDELIEAVRIPIRKGRVLGFFKKAGQRQGMCCSKASLAFWATRQSDGRLRDVRVAMGAVAPTVIRVTQAEQILEGMRLDEKNIQEAARSCVESCCPIDDIRSTREFRRSVVGALLAEGLHELMGKPRRPSRTRRIAPKRQRR